MSRASNSEFAITHSSSSNVYIASPMSLAFRHEENGEPEERHDDHAHPEATHDDAHRLSPRVLPPRTLKTMIGDDGTRENKRPQQSRSVPLLHALVMPSKKERKSTFGQRCGRFSSIQRLAQWSDG